MAEKNNETKRVHRRTVNEMHQILMSVLLMVCASNNFQINHQLSFEYNTRIFFHTTTFIAIRKYTTESACTAQTSIGSCSFFFFTSSLLVRCWLWCGVSFLPTQTFTLESQYLLRSVFRSLCFRWLYVQHRWYGIHSYIYVCISMYRFITHSRSLYIGTLPTNDSVSTNNNCTLFWKYLPNRNVFSRFFDFVWKLFVEKNVLSSKFHSKFM